MRLFLELACLFDGKTRIDGGRLRQYVSLQICLQPVSVLPALLLREIHANPLRQKDFQLRIRWLSLQFVKITLQKRKLQGEEMPVLWRTSSDENGGGPGVRLRKRQQKKG
jgi:hypothetical protein